MKPPLSRVPLLLPVVGLACGILLETFCPYQLVAVAVLAAGIVAAVVMRRNVAAVTMGAVIVGMGAIYATESPGDATVIFGGDGLRRYVAVVDNVIERETSQSISCLIDSVDGYAPGVPLKAMVQYISLSPQVIVGDTIWLSGELHSPASDTDLPDEFDYGRWLRLQGYAATGMISPGELTRVKSGTGWRVVTDEMRHAVQASIFSMPLESDTQEFLVAVLTGDDDILTDETRLTLSRAGVAHILALSGLHVGIIMIILTMMLYPLTYFMFHRTRLVVTLVALWAFALVTGLSTSVVRAVVMATFVLVGRLAGRPPSPLNSLLAAALVILMVTPRALYCIGFQMSFAAVAAILLFNEPIEAQLRRYGSVVHAVGSYLVATVAAMLSAGVISMLYFHNFPLYTILGNVVAAVLLPVMLGWGIMALIVGAFTAVPAWMCVPADWCYRAIKWVATGVGELPGAVVEDVYVTPWVALVAAVLIALIVMGLWRRRVFYLYAVATVAVIGVIVVVAFRPDYPEHEYFITRSSRATTIVARDGDSLYLVTTTPVVDHPDLLTTASERYNDYRGARGLDHFSIAPQHIDSPWLRRNGAVMDFGNIRLALIASNDHHPDSVAGVDVLIVAAGFTGDILELYYRVKPGRLILSADINGRRSRRYEAECRRAGVDVTRLRR